MRWATSFPSGSGSATRHDRARSPTALRGGSFARCGLIGRDCPLASGEGKTFSMKRRDDRAGRSRRLSSVICRPAGLERRFPRYVLGVLADDADRYSAGARSLTNRERTPGVASTPNLIKEGEDAD